MRVGFGEWTPDSPSLASSAIDAKNVYPRTSASYGPLSSIVDYSDAITGRCRGAFSARSTTDGTSITFAGDDAALYRLSGTTFSDVSLSGGYELTEYDAWEMIQFGDLVIDNCLS